MAYTNKFENIEATSGKKGDIMVSGAAEKTGLICLPSSPTWVEDLSFNP